MKLGRRHALSLALAPLLTAVPAQANDTWGNTAGWWVPDDAPPFDATRIRRQLPRVKVKGNAFVTEDGGEPVVFRGLNIADPDKIENDKRLTPAHLGVVAAWGANVIRVPVHPSAWRKRGKAAYLKLLDDVVVWANELGLYVILDWHSIGSLKSQMFQKASYHTTPAETYDFFRTVADRYKGVNAVAFYEIFNEPTLFGGRFGTMTWAEWKAINEEIITIIQAWNPHAISLVAGFNWAYDLKPVASAPIERGNVAYVSHPYPQKVGAPYEQNWDRDFGFVAARYPVFATEIGYQRANERGAHVPVIDDGAYGPRITDYFDSRGISWVGWVFDPHWAPHMFESYDGYEPTMQGRHFRDVMLKKNRRFVAR